MLGTRFILPQLAAAAMLLFAQTANADANLNCQAYAGFAVAQQEQNVALGCGFTGGAWSTDFNGHFAWCQLATTQMANLTGEDNARKAALNECATRAQRRQQGCQDYAQNSVLLARISRKVNCGLTGGRYSENYAGHFNWCLTVNPAVSEAEGTVRLNQVQGCVAAKQADKVTACQAYAETAVLQNEENQQRNCDFGGGRWSNDAAGHFNWCMGVGQAALQGEADIRNAGLRDQCRPQATSYNCWTETRAKVGFPPWKTVQVCKYN